MPVCLFSDFGASDPYAGQVKAALYRHAPLATVIDLLHEAPVFNVKAGAHLLAALAGFLPPGCVVLAVVDPGVGGPREPVALIADGTWFVGPDNGLLSVVAARASRCTAYSIGWRPSRMSDSFHGRDLFAPVAALIESGQADAAGLEELRCLAVGLGTADVPEVIYMDHYGNAMTGLRTGSVGRRDKLVVGGQSLDHARVFMEAGPGKMFWYENSIGLIEIAVNAGSARDSLGLRIGQPLELKRGAQGNAQ